MAKKIKSVLFFWLALGVAFGANAQEASKLTPLGEAQLQILADLKGDPEPEKRHTIKKEYEGQHFLTCDELNLQLFKPAIDGIGGAYAGVGTDQSYILMGWAKSELGFLFDYDPLVIRVHELYKVFFTKAETYQDFVRLWSKESEKASKELISGEIQDDPKGAVSLFHRNRAKIYRRLQQSIRLMKKANVAFYLNDQEIYDHIRTMIITGRVVAIQANLLDSVGLKEIGKAAAKIEIPIRVLYLSNVEDYWAYSTQYVQNLLSLHYDSNSLLLRTVAAKPSNGDYRYVLQSHANFKLWAESGKVKRTKNMFPRRAIRHPDQVQLITIENEPQ
ncbi:MAG TPA: hypothetical protein PK329_05405 [Myxococcota bacterium]|nr:hypothetical protein [Myxococcota bacterium]HOS61732.1 hypothetical protein [Myxococcota bacterium]HPL24774.1 hypothetical protein [Myxococcota bacterium]HQE73141.1 hypothetical protein [Myxococcota bacterium]HQI61067.1 hypothetical protein [Myxococcota bacterium]